MSGSATAVAIAAGAGAAGAAASTGDFENRFNREYYDCCGKYWEHSHLCQFAPNFRPWCGTTWEHHVFSPRIRMKVLKQILIENGIPADAIIWTVSFQTGFYVKLANQPGWVRIEYPERLYGNYRRQGAEVLPEQIEITYGVWDDYNEIFTPDDDAPSFALPIGSEVDNPLPEEKALNTAVAAAIVTIALSSSKITLASAEVIDAATAYEAARNAELARRAANVRSATDAAQAAATAAQANGGAAGSANDDDDDDDDDDDE